MTARTFRPTLEALEARPTPATLTFFLAPLGGQTPPSPGR